MKKRSQKLLVYILVFALMLSLTPVKQVEAAKKLKVTNQKNVTLVVKKTHKIKTNVSATFKSSNKKVATVSKKGVISAQKAGTAKITVTSKKNKNQKVTVKVTVKKKSKSTASTKQASTEQETTEKATTEQTTTEQATTEQSPNKEEPKPVSITANYTGGILPTYASIDFTKLSVITTFDDNSTKELSMLEYTLSTNYSKVEGEFTIEVYYQNLKTSFNVIAKEIDDDIDYVKDVSFQYSGGYPLDTSKLAVYLFRSKSFDSIIESPNIQYCGQTTRNGKKCHQYMIYYSEDISVNDCVIHNFAYDLLFIPVE